VALAAFAGVAAAAVAGTGNTDSGSTERSTQ